jgi:hypothetical protein
MAMECPQCRSSFDQRLNCPHCGVRLNYTGGPRGSRFGPWNLENSWQQGPLARLVAGVLLAQGFNHVLRHLCTAGLAAIRESADSDFWGTLVGLAVLQGFQALSVLVAGFLTGAGRRGGFGQGAAMGIANSVVFGLGQNWLGQALSPVTLVGELLLHAGLGAAGGCLGSLIWQPAPSFAAPRKPRPTQKMPRCGPSTLPPSPLAWGRALTGITLAVSGVVGTDVIRELVLAASEGKLKIESHWEAALVTWEISALALFAGGVLAGASTNRGSKQGLAAGLGTCAILLALYSVTNQLASPGHLLILFTALTFCYVGGWFGSRLLPPVSVSLSKSAFLRRANRL